MVVNILEFNHCADFLRFIPRGLEEPFTNKELAKALGVKYQEATRMTWCLRRMDALRVVGKEGNSHLHVCNFRQDWEFGV